MHQDQNVGTKGNRYGLAKPTQNLFSYEKTDFIMFFFFYSFRAIPNILHIPLLLGSIGIWLANM